MKDRLGVLVMAYGTPAERDEIEPYYTHIRRGRPPTKELLDQLKGRYEAIGGCSPLNRITREEARLLEQELNRRNLSGREFAANGHGGCSVYVGMKHCPPFIADVVGEMAREGVARCVGVVLAPHYSSMSVAVYIREATEAAALHGLAKPLFVRQWHLQGAFLDALEERLRATLDRCSESEKERLKIVFSAHSLPQRIAAQGDPYPEQLLETSRALADRIGWADWQFGWQSAGRTSEPWLGPDILQVMDGLAAQGYRAVISCPVGFVSDHLEVLYDLDIEAAAQAGRLGMRFERTSSLNTDHRLIEALASAVEEALHDDESS
ncbi:MAG: ferrochelatase [Bacilli bacterium]